MRRMFIVALAVAVAGSVTPAYADKGGKALQAVVKGEAAFARAADDIAHARIRVDAWHGQGSNALTNAASIMERNGGRAFGRASQPEPAWVSRPTPAAVAPNSQTVRAPVEASKPVERAVSTPAPKNSPPSPAKSTSTQTAPSPQAQQQTLATQRAEKEAAEAKARAEKEAAQTKARADETMAAQRRAENQRTIEIRAEDARKADAKRILDQQAVSQKQADKLLVEAKAANRSTPKNLPEQLTLKEAKSGSGREIMEGRIKDPLYADTDWIKKSHLHQLPGGRSIQIHYWENSVTKARLGFKFK
jgi:hypothetical protein